MLIAGRNAMMVKQDAPVGEFWWLCFTAEEAGSTVALVKARTPPEITLETSRDGLVWTPYTIGSTITLANVGDRIFFAAGDGGNTQLGNSIIAYHIFLLSGRIAASGNIMSLLNRNIALTEISGNYAFAKLFYGCTSLVTAPKLPATNLKDYCYYRMFQKCTSLSSVEVAFTDWNAANATKLWLDNVASTGIFRCPTNLGTNATIARGGNNCPSGWTVINTD